MTKTPESRHTEISVWPNSGPEGIKLFSCSTQFEHEILNAHKYKKKYQEIRHFLGSDKPRMLFFSLINV